jgi:hypothetical protein
MYMLHISNFLMTIIISVNGTDIIIIIQIYKLQYFRILFACVCVCVCFFFFLLLRTS